MCGIWTLVNLMKDGSMDIDKLFGDFWNLKNRGPDNTYLKIVVQIILIFKPIIM